MTKCSESQDTAVPCSVLALLVFKHSQTYTELSSQFCLVLSFITSFLKWKTCPCTHSAGQEMCQSGGLAACNVPSQAWSRLQVKHQGVRHSSIRPSLMGSDICFLPEALAVPGRSRGFTDSSLKCLSITPALGLDRKSVV